MKRLLIKWIILTLAIILTAVACGMLNLGFSAQYDSPARVVSLMIGAAVLAIVNATLGKFLKLLTLPLNCLTLGLMSVLINAIMLLMVGSQDLGFKVDGFLAALVGSILISVFNGLLGGLLLPDKDSKNDDD